MQLIIKLYLHLPFCYLFSIYFISLFLYYYNIAFFCVKHIHFGVLFLFSYLFLNYLFDSSNITLNITLNIPLEHYLEKKVKVLVA